MHSRLCDAREKNQFRVDCTPSKRDTHVRRLRDGARKSKQHSFGSYSIQNKDERHFVGRRMSDMSARRQRASRDVSLVARRSPLGRWQGRWCLECDDASGQHLPLDSTPGGEIRQTFVGRWTTGTRDSGKATCDNCHEQKLQSSGWRGNDVDNDRSISQHQSGAAFDFMLCYGVLGHICLSTDGESVTLSTLVSLTCPSTSSQSITITRDNSAYYRFKSFQIPIPQLYSRHS